LRYHYTCVTAGEKLNLHLRSEIIDSQAWEGVGLALQATRIFGPSVVEHDRDSGIVTIKRDE